MKRPQHRLARSTHIERGGFWELGTSSQISHQFTRVEYSKAVIHAVRCARADSDRRTGRQRAGTEVHGAGSGRHP